MMRSVLLVLPQGSLRVLSVAGDDDISQVEAYIDRNLHIPRGCYWLDYGVSRPLCRISLRLRLLGGKGGFGSNLRAQGSKMSSKRRRLGNESCRDLSGQRLRTLNQRRMVADYLARKPEMDRKREAEVRDRMLRAVEAPDKKPVFSDVEYLKTARETVDAVESAVAEALLGKHELDVDEEDADEGVSGDEAQDGDEQAAQATESLSSDEDDGKERAVCEDRQEGPSVVC